MSWLNPKQAFSIMLLVLLSATAFGQEIFRDNFDNNSNDWWTGTADEYSATVRNGAYRISHFEESGQWFFFKSIPFASSGDYIIEANITQEAGITDHGYGIIWGAKDANNAFCFIVNSGGSYLVYEYENGKYKTVKDWTSADNAVNPKGFNNKIQVRKSGTKWSFYVNDNFVYSMPVRGFYGDKLGFIINNKMDIAATDVSVTSQRTYNNQSSNYITVFRDDFNNNEHLWSENNTDLIESRVTGGAYNLKHKKEKSSYYFWKDIQFNQYQDFEISADITQVTGVDDYGFGITYGLKDVDNNYTFYVTSNGYFRVFKYDNGDKIEIKDWTYEPDFINPMGTANAFRVHKEGDITRFFVNGNFLLEVDKQEFYGPNVGFVLASTMEVRVENLEIKQGKDNDTGNDLKSVFVDNFDNNTNSWLVDNTKDYRTAVTNGHYYLQHKINESSFYFWNPVKFDNNRDFEIKVRLRQVAGVNDYGYGLLWGVEDVNNLNAFTISSNGFFRIFKYDNNEFKEPQPWAEVAGTINGMGAYNELTVRRRGNMLKFFVNDNPVTQIPYAPFFGDKMGFVLTKEMEVEVDRLEILEFSGPTINTTNLNTTVSVAPGILWTEPDGPVTQTTSRNHNISATVSSDSKLVNITLLVNNGVIETSSSSSLLGRTGSLNFSTNLKLIPGSNDVKIIAANDAGSTTSQSRTIIYNQPQPPLISWINPSQAFSSTNEGSVKVKVGLTTSSKLRGATVYLNDQPVGANRGFKVVDKSNNSGDYDMVVEETVNLVAGTNTVKIVAENENGSSATDSRNITYQPGADAGGLTTGRRDFALIFATDQYDHWNNLTNPVNDASTIAGELENNYGFNVELVKNPTTAEVMTTLRKYANKSYLEKDQLFIFFAGHGTFDDAFGEGYVVCKNSLTDDLAKTSYLSHSVLRTVINNIPSEHILVAMDVCFGGTFDQITAQADHRGGDNVYREITTTEYIERKLKYKTRRYMTSGGKEYVPDGRPGEHSPFARKFLEALRSMGGSDNILTLPELVNYIERVNPQPRYGEFGSNEPGSDFLFIGN